MLTQDEIRSRVQYDTNGGCWLWPVAKGYGCYRGKRPSRLSYEAFKGPIPEGLFVCHTCDVTQCVNPDHLWVGTASDNSLDMVKKGRHAPIVAGSIAATKRRTVSAILPTKAHKALTALAIRWGVEPRKALVRLLMLDGLEEAVDVLDK